MTEDEIPPHISEGPHEQGNPYDCEGIGEKYAVGSALERERVHRPPDHLGDQELEAIYHQQTQEPHKEGPFILKKIGLEGAEMA